MNSKFQKIKQKIKHVCENKKFSVIIIFYFIFIIVILIFAICKTGNHLVKIEVTVNEFSFDFIRKEGNPLFKELWAKKARFTLFKEFIIPFDRVETSESFDEEKSIPSGAYPDSKGEVKVLPTIAHASIIFDNILFSELNLKKNVRLTLSMPENEYLTFEIKITGASAKGKIDINKMQKVQSQHCKFDGIVFQGDDKIRFLRIFNKDQKKIDFLSRKDHLSIYLDLNKKQKFVSKNIYIKAPSFSKKVEEYEISSIIKPGKIVFKDMDDKEVIIEPHDLIKISHKKPLQITRLEFKNKGIDLVIIGEVNGLKAGTINYLTRKFPSILEWLSHKKILILIINIVLLFPAVIVAFIELTRLLKKNEDNEK